MRDIPEEMADRIESGAAMLCHAWVLRRGDGAVMGFTDHDRDLSIEGVVCRAGSGWTAGAGEGAVGLTAGGLSASGGLDDAAITEGDIAAGHTDPPRRSPMATSRRVCMTGRGWSCGAWTGRGRI